MQDVNATKEKIISLVQQKGPSLPVQIARMVNVSPLFTAVFLSELHEDNKLKTSHMKVGSSSIFYTSGQEAQLENFIEYLNPREKEAFFLIKNSQILEDSKQTPVMRVAMRAIKDFAIPFKITSSNTEKIFWKYYLTKDEEFDKKVQKALNPFAEIAEPKKDLESPQGESPQQSEELRSKRDKEPEKSEDDIEEKIEDAQTEEVKEEAPIPTKTKKKTSSEFAEKIKDYLSSKDIEILSLILEKKKEFVAKIRADTLFGKQEYYLIAKDKKKINETDITLALQKAQTEKMIALILSPGEIDKKASPHAKEWRNLIKFEKVSL